MTEKRFETYIENYLINHQDNGLQYHAVHHSLYDKALCLVGIEVIEFIKFSQPKSYEKWIIQFGEQADEKLLSRLSLSMFSEMV